MQTMTIDSNVYHGAVQYARRHKVSVRNFVETSIRKAMAESTAPKEAYKPVKYSWAKLNGLLKTGMTDEQLRDEYLAEKHGV